MIQLTIVRGTAKLRNLLHDLLDKMPSDNRKIEFLQSLGFPQSPGTTYATCLSKPKYLTFSGLPHTDYYQ